MSVLFFNKTINAIKNADFMSDAKETEQVFISAYIWPSYIKYLPCDLNHAGHNTE